MGRVPARSDRLAGAAQAPASLAVNGLNEPIREAAITRLQSIDPRTYVGLLINWIGRPTHYEVQATSSRRDDTVVMIDSPCADIDGLDRGWPREPGPGRIRHPRYRPAASPCFSRMAITSSSTGTFA